MLDIKQALKLTDITLLEKETKVRSELMQDMVGQLYPSVLYNEICKINGRISDVRFGRTSKNKEPKR